MTTLLYLASQGCSLSNDTLCLLLVFVFPLLSIIGLPLLVVKIKRLGRLKPDKKRALSSSDIIIGIISIPLGAALAFAILLCGLQYCYC